MAQNQDQDKESKTHEPTEKKLREARQKGDVPASRETGNMVIVVSLLGITAIALPWQISNLTASLSNFLDISGRAPINTGQVGMVELGEIFQNLGLDLLIGIAPVFMLLFVGAIVGAIIQGETVISLERVRPKLSKISPREGLRRLFSANSLVEFIKSVTKVLVVGALALWVTNSTVRNIWEGMGFLPESLPNYIATSARFLLIAVAIFLVPVAIADILWRRYDWRRRQMMSHKELRDELKETEGSPEIKGKRASIRRERAKQRIAIAVPKADVVLTNPTHFSVALKYDIVSDEAPICVAKGADKVAFRIREIAFDNEIPIIENRKLTRLLFESVEVEHPIPRQHWEMAAEIFRFVIELRKDRTREPPPGSKLIS